jgi:hypothetical protein
MDQYGSAVIMMKKVPEQYISRRLDTDHHCIVLRYCKQSALLSGEPRQLRKSQLRRD